MQLDSAKRRPPCVFIGWMQDWENTDTGITFGWTVTQSASSLNVVVFHYHMEITADLQAHSASWQRLLLKPKHDSNTDKVTAAEVTTVYHTVQHSQSYRSEDCGSKLTSVIFPDSDIAKRMSWGRIKAASIVALKPPRPILERRCFSCRLQLHKRSDWKK